MSETNGKSEQGFTLIEVLVALAIFSVAMAVLLSVFSDSLNRGQDSESEMVAGSLVQSLLTEVGVTRPLHEGEEHGDFNNGFRWSISSKRYGSVDDQNAWPVAAYDVTVSVDWSSNGEIKSKSLSTLRFAPKGTSK